MEAPDPRTSPTTTVDSPGWVGTQATASDAQGRSERVQGQVLEPLGRVGDPEPADQAGGQEPVAPLALGTSIGADDPGLGNASPRSRRRPTGPRLSRPARGRGAPTRLEGSGPPGEPDQGHQVRPDPWGTGRQSQARPGDARLRARDPAARSRPGRARAGPEARTAVRLESPPGNDPAVRTRAGPARPASRGRASPTGAENSRASRRADARSASPPDWDDPRPARTRRASLSVLTSAIGVPILLGTLSLALRIWPGLPRQHRDASGHPDSTLGPRRSGRGNRRGRRVPWIGR